MTWFSLATLGYLLLAIVLVLDKFILTKSVQRPVVYTFYSTIFMFGVLLLWPFGVELLQGIDWFWALVSGIAFGFALFAMYIALKIGEASHINPFVGGFIAIFTYVLSALLLNESLSSRQFAGLVILIFACFLLSFEKSKRFKGFHKGFLWAVLAGLLFAVSHVSAKYIYEIYDFLTGFVWTRATTGFVGLFLLLSPAVWATFKRKKRQKTYAKKYAISIVAADKILGAVGIVFIQYAIAIGSVTLVNAMVGMQYALMFLIILFLTKFFPKIFKEYFTRREIVVEVVALVLVVVGLGIFVL